MPRALAPDRDPPEPDEHWNNYNVSTTYALRAVRDRSSTVRQVDREAGRRPARMPPPTVRHGVPRDDTDIFVSLFSPALIFLSWTFRPAPASAAGSSEGSWNEDEGP